MNDPQGGDDSRSRLTLALVAEVLRPLARLLLRSGSNHASADEALRIAFVDVAREVLTESHLPITVSAVSMATGLHRREVKRLLERPADSPVSPESSLPSQLVTRWMTDRRYLAKGRKPRRLPRVAEGDEPSFDELARSVSQDVHPRSQLDELLRLGVIEQDGGWITLQIDRFVPPQSEREATALVAFNLGDHVATAVDNLTGRGPKRLEQAVFVDRLSDVSAEAFDRIAREQWARLMADLVPQLEALVRGDREAGRTMDRRARLGMYARTVARSRATGRPETPDAAD